MKYFGRSMVVFVVLVLSLPGLLYVVGISMVDGRPLPPESLATPEQQQEIWRHIDKAGKPPMTARLNPWSVALSIVAGKELNGARSVSLVAQNYSRTHLMDNRMGYWHLSSAAMAIWVSRHWSEEEVLSKVYELYSYELPYNQSPKPTRESPVVLRGEFLGRAAWLNR